MARLHPLFLLTLLAACGPAVGPAEGDPVEGLLTVRWSGTYDGSFTAPAIARWCQSDSLVEILAARADTGIGLIVLVQDSVRAGQYPISAPRVFIDSRPQAQAAARWLGRDRVLGFEGLNGRVMLTEAGERLTGRIEATLKQFQEASTDTLHLVGEFTRVPVRPATPPCGRLFKPDGG